ncbi:MAG: methyltransferase [Bacteroidetes bacterium]|nr:methyltransferase [Bacteroidota bacterium]
MHEQHQLPPPVQMLNMITGFWTASCIYNAARLNIADLLEDGPKSVERLAKETGTHAPSLYRLLRALAGAGVFTQNEKGEFANTTLSLTLLEDVPGSMKAMAKAQLGDHYKAWGNLKYSLKTGDIAFDHAEGMTIWEYYEKHPDDGLNFMKAMTGLTGAVIAEVVPAYDFSQFKTIVDIGGGNGAFLMAVLNAAPHARGIVFDQEYVVKETQKELIMKDFAARCNVEAGSFFNHVPAGADAYLMKLVLHDWNDMQAMTILTSCSNAMRKDSKLLIVEALIPEGNTPHPGKFMDINMMAMTGGKERTEKEFCELFAYAGLKLSRVIHTHSPVFSILEVIKA